jgi:hypothetical protein
MKGGNMLVPVERIEKSILFVRGLKVMLDRDLAELYGVETRVLNQAVRRNIRRFPDDFMISLSRDEIRNLSQFVTSSGFKHDGLAKTPIHPTQRHKGTEESLYFPRN